MSVKSAEMPRKKNRISPPSASFFLAPRFAESAVAGHLQFAADALPPPFPISAAQRGNRQNRDVDCPPNFCLRRSG
jgi:hypothetical protein